MSVSKPRILLQLDTDDRASSFDAVVAIDASVDHLLQYHGIHPENVTPLVHGTLFTRAVADLSSTAIFIGGSDVALGEQVLKKIESCFFGPMQVSVMLDSNGANTTAAAAILSCTRHLDFAGRRILVLSGTGAVGQRVCELAMGLGAHVAVHSRSESKAIQVKTLLQAKASLQEKNATPAVALTKEMASWTDWLATADAIIACGAAGVEILNQSERSTAKSARVLIDLNAVPQPGIWGIAPQDKAKQEAESLCYGALGVGGLKMKIHRRAIQMLFESNRCRLDSKELLELGKTLV